MCGKRTTNALIRLRICAVWPATLLSITLAIYTVVAVHATHNCSKVYQGSAAGQTDFALPSPQTRMQVLSQCGLLIVEDTCSFVVYVR